MVGVKPIKKNLAFSGSPNSWRNVWKLVAEIMPNWRVYHGLLVGLPIDSSNQIPGCEKFPYRLGKVPEECADMSTQQQLVLHGLNSI